MKGNPFLTEKFLLNYTMDEVKQLYGKDWWKLPPPTVEVDPTNLCNSRCTWCMFDDYRAGAPDSISPEDMERVIQQLHDFGVKSITFTGGGEPLFNDKVFPQTFHQAHDLGLKIGIVTNGINLIKYAKDIAETCTFVRVSLDAGTPKTLQHLKGTGDKWDTIMDGIKALVGKLDVGVAMLIHPDNYTEVSTFLKLCESLNVDYAEIRPVILPGLILSNEIVGKVMSQIEEFQKTNGKLRIICRTERFDEMTHNKKQFDKCFGTPLVGIVGADLNMYLCCQWRGEKEYSFGNLHNASFKDIWLGEKRRKMVESIDTGTCFPCRYAGYNKVLENLRNCDHEEFL
jgi:MoaA/NifB/PqqE/SkfB family radical SAM enzyme